MKETKAKVIKGKRFEFTELSPRRALPIYTFLMSLIGKTAAGAAGSIKNFGEVKGVADLFNNANVDLGQLAMALAGALETIDENPKLEQHVDTLLDCVICEGSPLSLDSPVFQCKMSLVTEVTMASIEVNFSDFFEGSGGVAGIMKKAMSSQDTQSDTPTSVKKTG